MSITAQFITEWKSLEEILLIDQFDITDAGHKCMSELIRISKEASVYDMLEVISDISSNGVLECKYSKDKNENGELLLKMMAVNRYILNAMSENEIFTTYVDNYYYDGLNPSYKLVHWTSFRNKDSTFFSPICYDTYNRFLVENVNKKIYVQPVMCDMHKSFTFDYYIVFTGSYFELKQIENDEIISSTDTLSQLIDVITYG